MKRGKFIVLEGIDCCGKDTQQEMLKQKFCDFVFIGSIDETREWNKSLRKTIFESNHKWTNIAEMLLLWADKFELIDEINNYLKQGVNVIKNRWEVSNLAYQIYGKQREDLREFAEMMLAKLDENLKPDLYILFGISTEESEKRKQERSKENGKFEDYYDNAKKDFFERVIAGYKTEIQKYNHVIINGEQSKEKVFEDTVKAIEKIL
jgi:dTMP kinase